MPDVIVIGAGISGLTAAHKLVKAGKDVIVLEESSRAGGKIVTNREGGYLLEAGPNSLRLENLETLDLIEEIGLTERILDANPTSKKRYVLRKSHWIPLPRAPFEAITTPLLSVAGKLRVLWEPFVRKSDFDDESAASFVRRRLGQEIFDYGADPFITGIYAGDPEQLSMKYAFPTMWNVEQEYGFLLKGLTKGRKGRSKDRKKPNVISFPEGLSELPTALRGMLGERLQLHSGAIGIERSAHGFSVTSSSGRFETSKIIFALPAYDVAPIVRKFSSELSNTLLQISYPLVAVVFLAYAISQFEKVPEGFGGLIPSKENRNILGVIFSSSNFPNRAPEGHLLLTVLMGGAKKQEIANWEEGRILETAISEVRELFKPMGEPAFQRVNVWKHAIPQYNIGYGAVLGAIERVENEIPGLHFIGNYRDGISLGACIKNATELVSSLV